MCVCVCGGGGVRSGSWSCLKCRRTDWLPLPPLLHCSGALTSSGSPLPPWCWVLRSTRCSRCGGVSEAGGGEGGGWAGSGARLTGCRCVVGCRWRAGVAGWSLRAPARWSSRRCCTTCTSPSGGRRRRMKRRRRRRGVAAAAAASSSNNSSSSSGAAASTRCSRWAGSRRCQNRCCVALF